MEIFIDGSFVEDKDHPPTTFMGILSAICGVLQRVTFSENSMHLTLFRFGPGIRRLVDLIVDTQRGKSPCGTNTVLSCIHTTGSRAAFETSMGMNSSFLSAFRQSRHNGNPKGIIKIGGHP